MPAIPAAALAWWEKTVEYAFLQQACRKWGVNFLAPLGVTTVLYNLCDSLRLVAMYLKPFMENF